MKIVRAFLLFLIVFLLFVMVAGPGLWDTKRRAEAVHNYRATPNEVTKAALEDAKGLDRRDMVVAEVVMVGVLCLLVFAYGRTSTA